jgi:hypothetical protein
LVATRALELGEGEEKDLFDISLVRLIVGGEITFGLGVAG